MSKQFFTFSMMILSDSSSKMNVPHLLFPGLPKTLLGKPCEPCVPCLGGFQPDRIIVLSLLYARSVLGTKKEEAQPRGPFIRGDAHPKTPGKCHPKDYLNQDSLHPEWHPPPEKKVPILRKPLELKERLKYIEHIKENQIKKLRNKQTKTKTQE